MGRMEKGGEGVAPDQQFPITFMNMLHFGSQEPLILGLKITYFGSHILRFGSLNPSKVHPNWSYSDSIET